MSKTHRLLILAATLAAGASQAHAADPVLTSLDVCDALGFSGLTLSSDANCLKISGSVYYEFSAGNYGTRLQVLPGLAISGATDDDEVTRIDDELGNDWYSYVEAYLTFEGAASSDFGPARAKVELTSYQEYDVTNGVMAEDTTPVELNYAYVAVGDQTVLSAGLQDSIINVDDDTPYDWLGSPSSNWIGDGVDFANDGGGTYDTEGHSIQIVSDLGNGLKLGGSLEALDSTGSAIGVVSYDGGTFTGHLSVLAGGILDGSFEDYAAHAGFSGTFDAFKVRTALAVNNAGWWNGLVSGELTLDMFTLAATLDGNSADERTLSGSAAAKLTDTLTVKVGARWIELDALTADDEGVEVRGRLEYAATESVTVAGEVGHLNVGANGPNGAQSIYDVLLEATWAPAGSGFTATLNGGANTLGGYKTTFTAEKAFE